MNVIDIVILLVVLALLFFALRGTLKHFGKKGGCCGCSGCSGCPGKTCKEHKEP